MIEQHGGIFDTHSLSCDEVFKYLSKNPHYETWYNSNASKIYDNGITVVSRPKIQQSCCEFLPLPSATIIEFKFIEGTISCTEYDFLYTEKKEALKTRKNLIKQLKSLDYSRTEKDSESETYDRIEAEFLIGNIGEDEDNGMTVYFLSIFVFSKDEI